MATKIADIIVPEVLTDMVSAMISPYIDFVKLGIATKDYENVDIREGGHFAEIPFYDQLTGDDEVLTDDTSMTPGKISTRKDIGVVCHRGRAWASRDLAKILSGDDPTQLATERSRSSRPGRTGPGRPQRRLRPDFRAFEGHSPLECWRNHWRQGSDGAQSRCQRRCAAWRHDGGI